MKPPGTAAAPDPVRLRPAVYLLFFLSGSSGLLFETLWTYQETLALGSGFGAVTAVLSAFMAGLALGNFLALRRSACALGTYAILEAVVLGTGLVALGLIPFLGRIMAPVLGAASVHPALLHALRFGISFIVLAVPSTAMGMTLPALAQSLGGEHGAFRAILGRLYGWNTLGAIAGVLAGELLLLPRLGIFGTGACAASLNGVAALGAWWISRRSQALGNPVQAPWDLKGARDLIPALVAVFLAGFALLALEVIWTRFLALFFINRSLSFAIMLVTVLGGIALGGMAGGGSWIPRPHAFLLMLGAGVAVLASYAAFPLYHRPLPSVIEDAGTIMKDSFLLQFPVSFLSGAFFTLAGTAIRERVPSSQAAAGLLVMVNTLGAAAGAVVAGYLLIPGLGVEKSLFVLTLVYALAGLLWARRVEGDRRWTLIGAGCLAAGLMLFPFGRFAAQHVPDVLGTWITYPGTRLVAMREGLTETIFYMETEKFGRHLNHRMLVNSFSMSANTVPADRYMKLFVYWPIALHPAPKDALLICFGVGSTAQALTRSRELEHIDMVDLSRDVLDLSSIVFPDPSLNPLHDPRVTVHVEDGRFYLQTHSKTWDVITGEPPPPGHPGVEGLYSREYFSLLRDHLSPGGIATYWLPIHVLSESSARSILKAWSEVFDTCFLWRGSRQDLVMVGFRGKPAAVTEARFAAQWTDPATASDLADVGFDLPELLGTGFVGDSDYVRSLTCGDEPTLDAYPKRIGPGGTEDKKMFETWFDSAASARRFAESRSIAALWPAALRERTLKYFPWETSLASLGSYPWRARAPAFSLFHQLCTETPLRTLVVWALDGDRDSLRAAAQAEPSVRSLPAAQYYLGVRALADRDFSRAADHFLRTIEGPEAKRMSLAVCLYCLCRAGRKDEADRIAGAVGAERARAMPPDFWAWMHSQFDLRFPPSIQASR